MRGSGISDFGALPSGPSLRVQDSRVVPLFPAKRQSHLSHLFQTKRRSCQNAQRAKTENPFFQNSFSPFPARPCGFTQKCCAKTLLFAQRLRND
jgi:hypothetical protein